MSLRAPRDLRTALITGLKTSLVGGLLVGATAIGAGTAIAAPAAPAAPGAPAPTPAPAADEPVPARCGQTVQAAPGQEVRVTPALGLPFLVPVEAGMDPIRRSVSGVLCRVNVEVIAPAAAAAAQAAPPLRPVAEAARRAADTADAAVDPDPEAAAAPAPAPLPAAAPAFTPEQAAAAAPAFGSAFGALPSSFLRSAAAPAPAQYDPAMLLGSAFGGLRAGAPAYLGGEPASAVTTASQIQALPVDGLAESGVGAPGLLAVLGLSGVTAVVVRRLTLRPRSATTGSTDAQDADSLVT